MAIKCPKCNYTRVASDTAPDNECPKCGVIYAKAKKQEVRVSKPIARNTDSLSLTITPQIKQFEQPELPVANIQNRQKQFIILAFVVGLSIGYFSGREHMKYELRSVFQDAATGIKKGLSEAFNQKDTKPLEQPISPPKARPSFPITASLVKKGWMEREYERNAVTFTVSFRNLTGKDIRAFDGQLVFTDLLGNEIIGANLAVNDPIETGKSLEWEGKLDYNQFISSHENLRNAETQNIKVNFILKRVLFAGGEIKEF